MATTAKKPAGKPMVPQGKPAQTKAQPVKAQPAPKPQQAKPSVPATVRPAQTQIAVQEDMSQVPAHLQKYAGVGTEDMRREDLIIPRLKLIQGLSPELQVYDELKAGHFFHTTAEYIFNEPFRAVVLFRQYRYILWNPLDSGGGVLARADDGVHWQPADTEFDVKLDKKNGGAQVKWATRDTVARSGLANWGTMNPNAPADNDNPPAATLMYEYILAFPDEPSLMPAAFTMSRSAIGQARSFNSKLKTLTQRFPIYSLVFRFESFKDTNKAGQEFFNANILGAGFVPDEKVTDEYRRQHETFASTGVRIKDEESAQSEYAGGDDAAENAAPEGAKSY